jgi:F0F1-type ATP synthase membrane subunit a
MQACSSRTGTITIEKHKSTAKKFRVFASIYILISNSYILLSIIGQIADDQTYSATTNMHTNTELALMSR